MNENKTHPNREAIKQIVIDDDDESEDEHEGDAVEDCARTRVSRISMLKAVFLSPVM